MLAVNVVVLIGLFFFRITRPVYSPYIHLLVDYHFGFTKRALIGSLTSLLLSKIPVGLVFALSGAVMLVTIYLFVRLFRQTFGFDDEHMPLFIFMAGSPFFLKNFMFSLGHFDIYGCLVAICLMLLPARSVFFVLSAAFFSAILILIHHIHLLMYVPTIAVIVLLRYYLVLGFDWKNVTVGIAALFCTGLLFLSVQFLGEVTAPPAEFEGYLRSRMADPTQAEAFEALRFAYIWRQPLSKEIVATWQHMPSNAIALPAFALLIWLHDPLYRYFVSLIRNLAEDLHRRVVIAAIVGVSAAYLIIFAIVFDYSRWISNWAVCMFLIMHAVKTLPSSQPTLLFSAFDRRTITLGWIVTAIPRVGIVEPFCIKMITKSCA
jgi:hypothetical protein